MARSPWIVGIVSLPTVLSQIALKFVITENDNNNSENIPVWRSEIIYTLSSIS